jgi:hypothetical protein
VSDFSTLGSGVRSACRIDARPLTEMRHLARGRARAYWQIPSRLLLHFWPGGQGGKREPQRRGATTVLVGVSAGGG